MVLFAPHVFPFTTDSAIYVSTARHINEGNGLLFDNVYVQPAAPDRLPLNLHPPGYSLLIAFLNSLGMDTHVAALALPHFFFLLLPLVFFLVFSQFMPKKLSMVTAGLCTFMFPYLHCALMAWSDIPFLFFSLASFLFLFKSVKTEGREQLVYFFLSGLSVGFSLLLRNVGYALAASLGLTIILMAILRVVTFKRSIQAGVFYILGFSVMVFPYWIRNYVVFGRVNPFQLPPSQVTLTQNLMDYGNALSTMIFTHSFHAAALPILLLGMFIGFLIKVRGMVAMDKRAVVCLSALILYFLAGSFLLILSKTLYFMPEGINMRYLIQYAWIVMAALSYSVYFLLLKLKEHYSIDMKGVAVLILLVFALVQVFPATDFYFRQKKTLDFASKVRSSIDRLKQIPEDHVIVSNVADMTIFFSGRNVRMLGAYTPYGLIKLLGVKKKFAVFLIKERDENFRPYLYPPSWLNPHGYRSVYEDDEVALWAPQKNEKDL